jgi:hypothetical protein
VSNLENSHERAHYGAFVAALRFLWPITTSARTTVESAKMEAPMIGRLLVLVLLLSLAIGGGSSAQTMLRQGQEPSQNHVDWVGQVLKRMLTIKPGMTRTDLLKVFATEGGLSSALRRTFVSKDCPYFKVDVEFRAVGRASRDGDGRETMVEGSQDIIMKMSRPYLGFSIAD